MKHSNHRPPFPFSYPYSLKILLMRAHQPRIILTTPRLNSISYQHTAYITLPQAPSPKHHETKPPLRLFPTSSPFSHPQPPYTPPNKHPSPPPIYLPFSFPPAEPAVGASSQLPSTANTAASAKRGPCGNPGPPNSGSSPAVPGYRMAQSPATQYAEPASADASMYSRFSAAVAAGRHA